MKTTTRRIVLAVLILVAAAAALAFWGAMRFKREPLASIEAFSRFSLRRAGAEARTVTAPSGEVRYFVAGEGSPVVLLHGANDQAGLWAKTVKPLKGSYRFIVPDLPGHGESAPDSGPLDLGMMLAAVEAVIDREAKQEPVTIVGNSMGGWVALLYAEAHPERVRELVLENSAGLSAPDYSGPSLLPKTRDEARAAFRATLVRTPVSDAILDDFVRRAPTSPAARMSAAGFGPYLLDDRLGSIRVPVTLVWGENDGILPLPYANRLQEAIPGAELHTIPRCGHVPHGECSEEFVAILRKALDS
jgi:pimeloyl-ACP methyl ester carboxylesterase